MDVLIVPGIFNSGPDHWQSLWQRQHAHMRRVMQRDWEHPLCREWVAALDAAIAACETPPLIAAHSLGCLAVAHWAAHLASTRGHQPAVAGALLVAVPDAKASSFPTQATGFAPVPQRQLPFPSIVVASEDDPYASLFSAQQTATAWGSRFVNLGYRGHINADSGLGDWPEGLVLLDGLNARAVSANASTH